MVSTLPEKIPVRRKNHNFFVRILYEKLPLYYRKYNMTGHNIEEYRLNAGEERSYSNSFNIQK